MIELPTILITGAARGLGAFLTERLAANGYAVAIHYRSSQKEAEELKKRIQSSGGNAEIFQGDLSKEQEANCVMAEVSKTFGRLNALIHNAGNYPDRTLAEISEAEWNDGLDSTINAAFFISRAALPLLRKNSAGRIIYIGDAAGERVGPREQALSYHIGKVGVMMLARTLAREEAPHGVTVNVVSPGMLENSEKLIPAKKIPAGRYGTFEDVWHPIHWLLSLEANYITGANIPVSGGWNLK